MENGIVVFFEGKNGKEDKSFNYEELLGHEDQCARPPRSSELYNVDKAAHTIIVKK